MVDRPRHDPALGAQPLVPEPNPAADIDAGIRRFAEYAPIHFGITDPANGGTFLVWNRVSEQMFGYSPKEAIGVLQARDLHASEKEFQAVLAAVDEGAFDGECLFKRKDGSTFPGRLRVVPVVDKDGQISERCGFIEDLSAAKAIAAELEEERRHRYHEDRIYQMGRLSGVIAHDINNVLFGILCTAQLMAEDLGEDHLCYEDLLTIQQAVDSASGLMRKLLTFTGRQTSTPQVVNVQSWIDEQTPFFARLVRKTTSLRLENACRQDIFIDPNDLQQVVMNLLVNADKAMPDGGELTVVTKDKGDEVEIRVIDTGIGIPSHLMADIFQPFFTTRKDGTGLGLSTARAIIRRAGGELSLQSEPHLGTSVTLSLPANKTSEVEGAKTESQPASGAIYRGQVLLVEDQPEVRKPLTRALRRIGFQVVEVESSSEAEDMLARLERLTVMIVDSKLADGAGEALIRVAQRAFPAARFILISGHLSAVDLPEARLFDARLAKPFSLQKLRNTLDEIME